MQNSDSPQYIRIDEDEFKEYPHLFYCPICYAKTFTLEEDDFVVEACQHTLFAIHTLGGGEYEFIDEKFNEKLIGLGEEVLDLEPLETLWEMTGYGKSLLIIELYSSGMACGPVSNSLYMGFLSNGKILTDAEIKKYEDSILN